MTRMVKILGWVLLAGLVLSALLVAGIVAAVGPLDPVFIQIDGEPLLLGTLDSLGPLHWLAAVGGVTLALLIVLLVVPAAVLVPLLIAALVLVGALLVALLAVAGAAALVLSPLILLAGLVWLAVRLLRGHRPKNGATTA